jgi:hypothetical protein
MFSNQVRMHVFNLKALHKVLFYRKFSKLDSNELKIDKEWVLEHRKSRRRKLTLQSRKELPSQTKRFGFS